MTDRNSVDAGWHKLGTSLTHTGRATPPEAGTYVNPPLERGSTVLFPSLKSMNRKGQERYDHTSIYGAMGSPTQHELEKLIARIEGGTDCQIVSSGLAACTTPLLAFLKAGDHCLLADSVYGPTRRFAENMLRRFGVDISYFPPCASRAEVEEYIQPNTRIIFTESPGSHTFEVQDIPMLAEVAHQHGARLFLDNTWGFGIFAPFEHGVDVSIQALTKYPSGHSDVIAGAITVADQASWHILRDAPSSLVRLPGRMNAGLPCAACAQWGCVWRSRPAAPYRLPHGLNSAPKWRRSCTPHCQTARAITCGSVTLQGLVACLAWS